MNIKRGTGKKVAHYLILIALTVLFIFPLVWMLVSSFKTEPRLIKDLYSGFKAFWPTELIFNNYINVFKRVEFGRYLFNSSFVAGSIVILVLIVDSMAGYSLARFDFPGQELIFMLILSLIIVPGQAILLPRFLIVQKLGWFNSYNGLIFPFVGNALAIYIFRQFFLNLPEEMEEAARIDGCGLLRMYFSVIVPMSKPVFASVAVLTVKPAWNMFVWPLVILNDSSMFTIQIGIQKFFHRAPIYYSQIMAALVIASLPMIILFLLLQDYFVEGMSGMGK